MKKYIIIPDFVPLYAMRKVFGPQTGPVRKPIRVDTTIIRQLLQQKPKVRVFEVLLTNVNLLTYDKKVELTLDNFDKANFENTVEEAPTTEDETTLNAEPDTTTELANDDSVQGVPADDKAVETVVSEVELAEKIVAENTEPEITPTETATGAAVSENPQRLTKAQRRAMERAKQGKAAHQ